MTMRTGGDDAARRAYLGVSRATVEKVDDKPKMQELTVSATFGGPWTNVERWQQHGFSVVPLEPDKDGEAEVLMAYLGGSPDHPIAISVADRRHRPKDGKPGDVRMFDHRKQSTVMTEDGVTHSSPNTITHNVVDGNGKVLSSIVQHKDGKKITMTNADGGMLEMDGPNIKAKTGPGGSHDFDGPVNIKGKVTATESVSAPTLNGVLGA